MAYYDALISQVGHRARPDTTDSKIIWINAQTVTGQIPASFYTTADQLLNCINYNEFKALAPTPDKQKNLLALCNVPGPLLGGSANVALMVAGMFVDYFPQGGPTMTSLTALAKAQVMPWWQATVAQGGGGLSSPVSKDDCNACVPPLV